MNILILGAYCSCNLGDAVICDCVADTLRRAYPHARIEIRDPVDRKREGEAVIPPLAELAKRRVKRNIRIAATKFGVDLTARRENRRMAQSKAHLDAVCAGDYDVVIFAGGQLFMDGYGAFLAYCTEKFAQRKIPVFFNACGVGPADSGAVTRQLAKAMKLPNVRHISCRDDAALVQKRYQPALPVLPTADPALSSSRVYGIQAEPRAVKIGLGVLYPNTLPYGKTLRFWRNVIRELDSREVEWELFSNGDPADMAFARDILEGLPRWKGHEEKLRPCDRGPEALLRTVAGYRGLISCRLHSHIIAASLGIPTAAVVWDDKLRAFFRMIGCPERCVSVDTSAEKTVAVLENAAARGYDFALLDSLSSEAEGLLLGALEKEGIV